MSAQMQKVESGKQESRKGKPASFNPGQGISKLEGKTAADVREVIMPLCLLGRFTRHGWRLDVYIDLLGLTAAAGKVAAEEEKGRSGSDNHKDHQYGHDCGAAAATIVISHKIHPPLRTHDSLSSAR